MRKFFTLALLLLSAAVQAQGPEVTSWIVNLNNALGYNNIPSNVQMVRYSTTNVYISCTGIPSYDIGPWNNPNTATNQSFVFKLTRNPVRNTGTLVATPNGHIGVLINGVTMFNTKDARSFNSAGIWNQNAIITEAPSFDTCLGHPQQQGEYHHHMVPKCLYNVQDSSRHSSLVGYAFDGFPVYGGFGYVNTNGTGGLKRMRSSYVKRNITQRHTLPDGTQLTAAQYGPDVNTQYPLGYYNEDYAYVAGSGDLDEFNGRFTVTPEYPNGIYAYFVTTDWRGTGEFPYLIGPNYYGTVQAGNTGPNSGRNTPGANENVTQYIPNFLLTGKKTIEKDVLYPNPARETVSFKGLGDSKSLTLQLFDMKGIEVLNRDLQGYDVCNIADLGRGVYRYVVKTSEGESFQGRIVKD